MASITSQLIVQLLDRVTGPAKAVSNSLRGITKTVKEASAGTISLSDRVNAAMTRNQRALADARAGILDAVATFYVLKNALGSPIQAAREYEVALTEIGNKSGMTKTQLTALGAEAVRVGKSTNQFTKDILSGADILLGYGVSAENTSGSLKYIGKTATATGASVRDLSELAYASMSNLKIPADQLGKVYDGLDKAGKEGGFELKDMAQYFPALGASMQGLGYDGTKAAIDLGAALQIVRRGAGDSATAANNLANVMQKMTAPQTQAAFKKYGFNVRKELEKGIKKGRSPIEVFTELTRKALKKGALLTDLFSDKQVQEGMRPLLKDMEDYINLREKATKADGTVDGDFLKKMETNAERTRQFEIALENLKLSIGQALLPTLTKITEAITPFINKIAEWTEKHPKLTTAIVSTASGVMLLSAALAILRYTSLLGFGGLLTLASNIAKLSGAMLLPGLSVGALLGVSLGLGAIAAAAGLFAYINWDEITSGWDAFWNKISVSEQDSAKLSNIADRLKEVSGVDFSFMKMEKGSGAEWGNWLGDQANDFIHWNIVKLEDTVKELEAIKKFISDVRNIDGAKTAGKIQNAARGYVDNLLSELDSGLATLTEKVEAYKAKGAELGSAMVEGIKNAFNNLMTWFSGLPARIIAAIGSIDLSGIITTPDWSSWLPSWANGSGPVAKAPNRAEVIPKEVGPNNGIKGNAKGGPISRGASYWVGEKGPELITAGRSGYVNRAGAASGGGAINVSPVFNMTFNGKTDPEDVVQQIRRVLRDEVRETFRGVFADTSMRFA